MTICKDLGSTLAEIGVLAACPIMASPSAEARP
jgi:hypothetical protein